MGKDIGGYVALSIGLFLVVSIVGGSVWATSGGFENLYQRRANRRAAAARNVVHFPGFDGVFEHPNGTANGTTAATASDAAQSTTHASADDTTTGTADGNAYGAASEPP